MARNFVEDMKSLETAKANDIKRRDNVYDGMKRYLKSLVADTK